MTKNVRHGALLLVVGTLGCGGKSTTTDGEISEGYCADYPEDTYYCDGERFSPERALELVEADGGPPDGSVLVQIQSGSEGGLAPDGLLASSGKWRLVYFASGGEVYDYVVALDGTDVTTYFAQNQCGALDEVTIEDVSAQVRAAKDLLEESRGVKYEPGAFSLNFVRYGKCRSPVELSLTLVHSQTGNPIDSRYTAEFSSENPGGIVCEIDIMGCSY